MKDLNNQHHDQPLLANYFLASSPLSSSSSLSESNTLTSEGGLNSHGSSHHGSTASSPTGHVSTPSASLPHKLRHKLQSSSRNVSDCEPANENASVVMRQVTLASNSFREEESEAGKRDSLKEENYTLRNELQRLATEVASLKTILLPVSPCASGQQQQETSFSPSPSLHQRRRGPHDQDMDTGSEKGALDD